MAIAFVQQASQINSSASASITATVSALTTGNWLIVAGSNNAGANNFTGIITVGSGSIEWYERGSVGSGSTVPVCLYVARIVSGGATTVVLNGASNALAMEVIEFSSTNPLKIDASKGNNGTATSVTTGNTASTAVANELWLGCNSFRNDTISSIQINGASPDNSYNTVTTGFTTTANRGIALAYKIASSTAATNYTATLNQTSVWSSLILALREEPYISYSRSRVVNNQN
jgi:hypothetical protein